MGYCPRAVDVALAALERAHPTLIQASHYDDILRRDRDGFMTGATYVQDGRDRFRPARLAKANMKSDIFAWVVFRERGSG
jgi:hypothetical protein